MCAETHQQHPHACSFGISWPVSEVTFAHRVLIIAPPWCGTLQDALNSEAETKQMAVMSAWSFV